MPIAANPLAIAKVQAKTPVISRPDFGSAAWNKVPIELRESSWFSAKISNLRFLQETKDGVERAVSMLRRDSGAFQSRPRFIEEMQKLARDLGLTPTDPRLLGTVQDPTSERRLGLIWDIQKKMAQGFARWKGGQDPEVLNAFPGYEFKRVAERKEKRLNWPERFIAAGGQIIGGRMVALKNDPCWEKLSVFGTPWEPFDYGSGMGLVNLGRLECEKLGLIKPGEVFQPKDLSFNSELKAPIAELDEDLQRNLQESFGRQLEIKNGVARWQGNVIDDFMDKAIADPLFDESLDLGLTNQSGLRQASALNKNLQGYKLSFPSDAIREILRTSPELAAQDLRAAPFVWRNPDSVLQGDETLDLLFSRDLGGDVYEMLLTRTAKGKQMKLKTLLKTKA